MSDHHFGGLNHLLDRIEILASDPETAAEAAHLTAATLRVLGSGPVVAEIDGLVATNQANGLMYYNAVHNQQVGNIVGMVATMRAVAALLDDPPTPP